MSNNNSGKSNIQDVKVESSIGSEPTPKVVIKADALRHASKRTVLVVKKCNQCGFTFSADKDTCPQCATMNL